MKNHQLNLLGYRNFLEIKAKVYSVKNQVILDGQKCSFGKNFWYRASQGARDSRPEQTVVPIPVNISYHWNFGFLLLFILVIQIATGFYINELYLTEFDRGATFESLIICTRDSKWSIWSRVVHSNGARFIFAFIYWHIARGVYYGGHFNFYCWDAAVLIFACAIITAFLGYVLPIGQISLWGVSVITKLVTPLPCGEHIVHFIWGGPEIGPETIKRFLIAHFVFAFRMCWFVVCHLFWVHKEGSSNVLGLVGRIDGFTFKPSFGWKDFVSLRIYTIILVGICYYHTDTFIDPVNSTQSDPRVTPSHIQPEWYFLFAYTILRRMPTKPTGVLAIVCSVLVIRTLREIPRFGYPVKSNKFNPLNKLICLWFVVIFCALTYLGASPADRANLSKGFGFTICYFLWFPIYILTSTLWGKGY